MSNYVKLVLLLSLIPYIVGCGGKPASVTGVVTLNGEPLAHGTVGFAPTGPGLRAASEIQSDGTYELQTNREAGLDVGEYAVTVASREPGQKDPNGGPPMPGPFITPRQYAVASTSGLKYQVESGSNEINIELTGEPKDPKNKSRGRR